MLNKDNANEIYQRLTSLLGSLDWKADATTLRMKMGQAYALTHQINEIRDASRIRDLTESLTEN